MSKSIVDFPEKGELFFFVFLFSRRINNSVSSSKVSIKSLLGFVKIYGVFLNLFVFLASITSVIDCIHDWCNDLVDSSFDNWKPWFDGKIVNNSGSVEAFVPAPH